MNYVATHKLFLNMKRKKDEKKKKKKKKKKNNYKNSNRTEQCQGQYL